MPPMLPAANPKKDNFAIGTPGQWDRRDWGDLANIADRTDYPASRRSRIEVDLIPDVWARVILFAKALHDEDHTLHKIARSAFRGFLALLALRVRKGLNVSTEPVQLKPDNTWAFAAAVRQPAPEDRALHHGLRQLYSDTNWNDNYLFRIDNGAPIGITSPLTLVCPAEGTFLTGLSVLPSSWFNGATFQDPSAEGVLNQEDRNQLAGWINNLYNQIAKYALDESKLRWSFGHSRLLRQLQLFSVDLRAQSHAYVTSVENQLRLGTSAYSYLAAPIKAEEPTLESSDIILDTPLQLPNTVLLPVRVHDQNAVIKPEQEPSTLCVVRGTSLLDINIGAWGDSRRILAGRALPPDAEWLDPKSLFLDRLFLLKGTQQRAGLLQARGQRHIAEDIGDFPILPLSPRITELLPGRTINNCVEFSETGGDITVKLRLPLKNARFVEVTRTYTPSEQTSLTQMPVLEVWPPFRRNGWRYYDTFWWANSPSAFTAEPFPKVEESVETEHLPGGQEIRVSRLKGEPQGFVLTYPQSPTPGRSGTQIAGIVLLDLPEIKEPPRGTWVAGVDFGTSSTNVILRTASDDYEDRLALQRSGPLRVIAGLDADRFESLYKYFLPYTPENKESADTAPFLSVLRMRHPDRNTFREITDAHIFFYSRTHNPLELASGRLATNLKWEGESRAKSEPYLRQLCLQTTAEAVMRGAERIEWRYSLPTALNNRKRNDYHAIWGRIVKFIAEETGLPVVREPQQMTESFATARYFTSREDAAPQVGTVFLDIGGGTSDISIWQGNEPRYQVSIRFAGRDIFLAPLFQKRKELVPNFAMTDNFPGETANRLIAAKSESEFSAQAEAMLRDFGRNLPQNLQTLDRLELLASPVRLGLAGLFYYLGIVLRALEKNGQYQSGLNGIFVGGNGSQLLHWADDGEYKTNGGFARVLKACLAAGAQWTGNTAANFQIRLSRKPKEEAATGLVVPSALNQDTEEHWDDVIAGETFTSGGTQKLETDTFTRDEIASITMAALPQLEDFYKTYIRAMDRNGFSVAPLPAEYISKDVLDRVRQFIADQRSQVAAETDLTPLFITALQRLVLGSVKDAGVTAQSFRR
jgi:hypothetical protein